MSEIAGSQIQARKELFDEYLKLTDLVHQYDDYFLRIKTWGVTASAAAIGVGLSQASSGVLGTALVLAGGFWITEVHFKMLQLGHMRRTSELESELATVASKRPSPRIFGALYEERVLNMKARRYRSVIWWPQVMFPHVCFVALAALALLYTALARAT